MQEVVAKQKCGEEKGIEGKCSRDVSGEGEAGRAAGIVEKITDWILDWAARRTLVDV